VLSPRPASSFCSAPAFWIDSHCHLDALEFETDRDAVRARARAAGVDCVVLPAVQRANFALVREWAHRYGDAYALGIHPLYVAASKPADLEALRTALVEYRDDPRLVAVGEIGLDYFVPALCQTPLREQQEQVYAQQLQIACELRLPVILHVRRSADILLKHLRRWQGRGLQGGIAHAFNGSLQQAQAFIDLGFKLGFGGALSFDSARHLRRLSIELPLSALVLETDAPDIPPQWLYRSASERAHGMPQGRNEPAELPRIAQVLADLRGISLGSLQAQSSRNVMTALPKLAHCIQNQESRTP
jgi:TatD DNase family protein